MMRTQWLHNQLVRWIQRYDESDIETVEVEMYTDWNQYSYEQLCLYTRTTHISFAGATDTEIAKRDLLNRWIMECIERMEECVLDRRALNEFPRSIYAKIVEAVQILSRSSASDARRKFLYWHKIVNTGALMGWLTTHARREFVHFLNEVSTIYYDCVNDKATGPSGITPLSFRNHPIYKQNEEYFVCGLVFKRVYFHRLMRNKPEKQCVPAEGDVCCVCLDAATDWCQCPCDHSICATCFPSYYVSSSVTLAREPFVKCPLCRADITWIRRHDVFYVHHEFVE
jgi:hypothetical protein